MKIIYYLLILIHCSIIINAQSVSSVRVGVLKYRGGGDWYANPTSLPNLAKFCNENINTNINLNIATVEVGSSELFSVTFVHMTGHGNVLFSQQEAENLRMYLLSGGFLHIDDNYGLDVHARREMKKVFPELDFVELPTNHPIYNQAYNFPKGLPKIHEHDNKPAQGFGIFYDNRLVCYYTYECDLGDGWEDPEVHNNSEEIRMKALKMGSNIIQYSFTH